MSVDFKPADRIKFDDLFDGRLEKFGVREHPNRDATVVEKCLTDGENYLWVYADKRDHSLGSMTRWAPNPQKIIQAIEEAFDTAIYSEHEPQYWGFDTKAEWEAAERRQRLQLELDRQLERQQKVRGAVRWNRLYKGFAGLRG
jgi:hypothetical protein